MTDGSNHPDIYSIDQWYVPFDQWFDIMVGSEQGESASCHSSDNVTRYR